MPNAKTGTVTFDIAEAVRELKAGKVEFKVDKAGVLHAPLGKVSFGSEKILQNFRALTGEVMRLKPSGAKGTYLKALAVSTTMGPGFKVDPLSVRRLLEG
jgi:large subunit ribosomal protein L1